MTDDVRREYFDWLRQKIFSGFRGSRSYERLLGYLMDRDFTFVIDMDGNRYEDGVDLRYQFAVETGVPASRVSVEIDDRPCSVLEMMVALALRCERDIMQDPYAEDHTSRWFWSMIDSLGLTGQEDPFFVREETAEIIDRFLNRQYAPNGKGGLFTLRHPRRDMRTVEIWCQAMWYLTEKWKDSERRAE